MICHTIQIARHRKAVGRFLDVTIKSGAEVFAPTWNMLTQYKSGDMSSDEYTKLYYQLIVTRFKCNPQPFFELLQHDAVTLGCYCKPGDFCHRLLLVKILRKIAVKYGYHFEYKGEICY